MSEFNSNNSSPQQEEIDVRYWLHYFLSRWYIFVAAILLCVGVAVLYLRFTAPTYVTSATILLREGAASDPMEAMGVTLDMFKKGTTPDDEMEIIRSKSLSALMVQELGLQQTTLQKQGLRYLDVYGKEPLRVSFPTHFLEELKGSLTLDIEKRGADEWYMKGTMNEHGSEQSFEQQITTLQEPVKTPWGLLVLSEVPAYISEQEPLYKLRITAGSPKATLEHYNKMLQVSQTSKKSNAIRIGVQGNNARKSEAIVNKMVELYNRDGLMEKNQTSMQLANFINERLVLLSQELISVEQDVESYRKEHQLADLSSQSKLFIESAGEYDSRVAEMDIQYSLIQFIENYLKQHSGTELIPGTNALEDPALAALIAEYNNTAMELLRLSRSTNAENPMVQQKEQQLKLLRENILSSIANAKVTAEITRRDLLAKGASYTSKIEEIPAVERGFIEMSRQQAIKQELYLFLLKKREETQLTLASATNNTRLVDAAYTAPQPVAPKSSIILLVALVLGVVLAGGVLILLQLLHDTVPTKAEVQRLTKTPILGEVNYQKELGTVVFSDKRGEVLAEQSRNLRANLNFFLPAQAEQGRVVLVTSGMPGEGKSFIAINLAIALSLLDKRVALVGVDLRRPMLQRYLNVKGEYGVTDFLTNSDVTIEEMATLLPGYENLAVFTAGPVPPNPSELLAGERFAEFIQQLRSRYDYVVLDSSPIELTSDPFTLAEQADMVAYICRLNVTPRSSLRHLDDLIAEGRLHHVGLVVNGVTHKGGYGYGYGYGYGNYK